MIRHLLMLCALLALVAFLPACATHRPDHEVLRDVQFDPATIAGKEGFFRVGKTTGPNARWFFIDPDNAAFFYRGVTSINREGTQGGRRAKAGPYYQAITAKFGTDPVPFRDESLLRLRRWGFNALGAWCSDFFFDAPTPLALPYTEITEFAYCGPQIRGNGINVPDVFDPAWEKAIDTKASVLCTPRRNSRLLVGYFTDNELGWAQYRQEDIEAQNNPDAARRPVLRPMLLQQCLSLPENAAAYKAAWDFVLARHGNNLEQLARDWDVKLEKREDIRKLTDRLPRIIAGEAPPEPTSRPGARPSTRPGAGSQPATRRGRGAAMPPTWITIRTPGYLQDEHDFSVQFARRYFHLSAQAIRRHDPNHLILGCRFGGPPGEAVLSAMDRRDVDVVSANNYQVRFADRMDIYHQGTGLPVLNGEFAWAGGHFKEAAKARRRDMIVLGQKSIEEACRHPALVGYTWYRWVQAPPPGPEGVGYGLVDTHDDEVRYNTAALTEVNAKAATLALHPKHVATPATTPATRAAPATIPAR